MEKDKINWIWHHSDFTVPQQHKINQTLPQALNNITKNFPNSPAIICEGITYSFTDLINKVAGISEEINEFKNHKGPIALIQSVGIDAIAAWFACSLAGKTFLLLDPNYPIDFLNEIITNAGCTLALIDETTESIVAQLPQLSTLKYKGKMNELNPNLGLTIHDPAMLFPTSGSTGKPKLITYTNQTLQVKVQSSIHIMQVPQGAKVFIAGAHSNYGFLHHALVFLLSGGTVCLSDIKTTGFDSIINAIQNLGVRHVRFTPSLFRKLAQLPQAQTVLNLLEAVRFSGEPLLKTDLQLANSVLNPNCIIQNVYGSTESALFIWDNKKDKLWDDYATVPIGKIYPFAAYSIEPIEQNEENKTRGELFIKSTYNALGDYTKGEINKSRFRFLNQNLNESIYATGDIVQQLPDGNLIHLGRLGRMVKIRGNRVYLSEVEDKLRSISEITGAAVIDFHQQDAITLHAFITSNLATIDLEEVRHTLAQKVPDFMLPKTIKILNKIPLLTGGKTDYTALKALIQQDEIRTPPNEILPNEYAKLVDIWDTILWKGAHNTPWDFFALGGDSLSFMVLLAQIQQQYGKNILPNDFKTKCTITSLAQILGIEALQNTTSIFYKSLKITPFDTNKKPTSNIALAMPGINGFSYGYPFYKAKYFTDCTIWSIDYPIKGRGNILQNERWWEAVQDIIQAIQEEIIPIPKVIFGFSFSGSLVWIIGKLLAGTKFCPQFILMIDSPPIHKKVKYKTKELQKALKAAKDKTMPKAILIERAKIGKAELWKNDFLDWNKNDGVNFRIALPNVDHLDMINWQMLALAKDNVDLILNNQPSNFDWRSIDNPPNLLGCQIFYALQGNQLAFQNVLAQIPQINAFKKHGYLIEAAILMYVFNYPLQLKHLVQMSLKKWPQSGVVKFLYRRTKRPKSYLFYEGTPMFLPLNMVEIENKLTALQNNNIKPIIYIFRFWFLLLDVLYAFVFTRYNRIKTKHK